MGLFSDKQVATYGDHSIVIKAKTGLLSVSISLYIDDKLIDQTSTGFGTAKLIGLIQEDGIDKPVKVKITQTVFSSSFELFINHNQIPLFKVK